jgi:hypothetical protein
MPRPFRSAAALLATVPVLAALALAACGEPVHLAARACPCGQPLPPSISPPPGDPTQWFGPPDPSPSPDPGTSTPPPGDTTGHYRSTCRAAQFRAHVTRSVSVANQPLTVIALHNTAAGCYLDGYVTIQAVSGKVWGTTTVDPLRFSVTHSDNYEVTDPGPSHVDIPRGGNASFAIGTATALDNPLYWLTSLTVSVPGDPAGITVSMYTAAMGRHGQPIPISETAIVAGQGGPPEQ